MKQFKLKSRNSFVGKPSTAFFRKKSSAGLTLMEIIIYIGIMGLVLSSMLVFAITISNNQNKAYSASEVEVNVKIVLDKLTALIHSARSINETNSVFNSDQGVLALYLGPEQTNPVLISLANGRVKQQINVNPAQFLSSQTVNFSRLKFIKLSDNQLSVEMSVAYGVLDAQLTKEKKYEQSIKTAITLRR